MRPADFNIEQLIEDLQGTTSTINDHLPDGMDENDLTSDDHDAIDNAIFYCSCCGWWCEISEMADTDEIDQICEDCNS